MSKFITLTNAAEDFDGRTIIINVDHIASIMIDEQQTPVGSILYCPVGPNMWQVKETIDEVLEKINSNKY